MKSFYVGCKAIIQDKDKGVLLLTRNTDKGVFYDVPGGRIDGDETFDQTIMRELAEELPGCIGVKIGKLISAKRIHKDIVKDISLVLLFFSIDATLPNNIQLSEEHDGYLFIKRKKDIPHEAGDEIKAILEMVIAS